MKKDYQRERNEELRLAYAFAITLLGDRAFLDSLVLALPSRVHGERCRRADSPPLRDPDPVVVLVPRVGLLTFAREKPTRRSACISALRVA